MYEKDPRVVLTLDAGGTNFVFSAIRGCREVVTPIRIDAVTDRLEPCLEALCSGFEQVLARLDTRPSAISFAFPGPADYKNGIIGDLPNFKAFRGGVALGPFLERRFGLPVFINNDGNLFAYGEALCGILPELNRRLAERGSRRRYRNLLGITLGTGFGAGVVIDRLLLTGDNGCGGDVWLMRNSRYPDLIAEESVSARAVVRVYAELAGSGAAAPTPQAVFEIAEGLRPGNREAARQSFYELGAVAGDAIVHAIDIVDGIVVVGGGVARAFKYICPGLMDTFRSSLGSLSGATFPSLQSTLCNLTDPAEMERFLTDGAERVRIPFSDEYAAYTVERKTGIARSLLGTSRAVALGAYVFALAQLDGNR